MMEKLGIGTLEKNVLYHWMINLVQCSTPHVRWRDCSDELSYRIDYTTADFKSFRPGSETLWKNGKRGGRSDRLKRTPVYKRANPSF